MDVSLRPLPLAYYYDRQFTRLRHALYSARPSYAGSSAMVPERGDFRVLEGWHDGYTLLNDPDTGTARLLSNICRHKQALLIDPSLPGRSRTGNVHAFPRRRFICPMHKWGYEADGRHCAAPHFPKETRVDLPVKPLVSWNGLFFTGAPKRTERLVSSLETVGHSGRFDARLFDLAQYDFVALETYRYANSAELMVEVYLDLNHDPYHQRTFIQMVDWNRMEWEFGDAYSVQVIPWKARAGAGISEKYRRLRELTAAYYTGDPAHGALWMTIYPNVMVEWYPMMLVVSTVYPDGEDLARSVNHVEYYIRKEWSARRDEIFPVQRAAYDETAGEDEEICESIERGRLAEWRLGEEWIGPTHPHRELGIARFHAYIARELDIVR